MKALSDVVKLLSGCKIEPGFWQFVINTTCSWDVPMFYAFMENCFNTLASTAKQNTNTKQNPTLLWKWWWHLFKACMLWGHISRYLAAKLAVVSVSCLLCGKWILSPKEARGGFVWFLRVWTNQVGVISELYLFVKVLMVILSFFIWKHLWNWQC